MNKPTPEVSQIPCRLHVGPSGESFACPSGCPCDGRPQFVGQHSSTPTSALTTIELDMLRKALRSGSRELISLLSEPNDSQPDPIIPIGGGRYVDLSRVQDIEPKERQVCLTLVSGAVAWAPIEMAGELIQAWAAIRRAQVWGRAK